MRCQGRTQKGATLVKQWGNERCSKEATEEVGGYHFCHQHARIAEQILDKSPGFFRQWVMDG